MLAQVLERPGAPLVEREFADPTPGAREVLLEVLCTGVCRTDLHVFDGELEAPRLPLILGHEIVGVVVARGPGAERFELGARVGVPWLGWTCGACDACRAGRENLCERARFTGYTRDGGYATHALADERYCLPLPSSYDDVHVAPLLCAGLIGYRALRAAGDPARVGIYGFGAAGHIVAQVARAEGREVLAFTRPGDDGAKALALGLGAVWAGSSEEQPPAPLDAAILFAPAGSLVPRALGAVRPGGTVVCGGIHMSDLPSMPYRLLWGERVLRSIANLTRRDGEEFFALAARVPLETTVEPLPLADANRALRRFKDGEVTGALVLENVRR
jgi:alcohol dehydrogenase, propanol-preferring